MHNNRGNKPSTQPQKPPQKLHDTYFPRKINSLVLLGKKHQTFNSPKLSWKYQLNHVAPGEKNVKSLQKELLKMLQINRENWKRKRWERRPSPPVREKSNQFVANRGFNYNFARRMEIMSDSLKKLDFPSEPFWNSSRRPFVCRLIGLLAIEP